MYVARKEDQGDVMIGEVTKGIGTIELILRIETSCEINSSRR